MQRRSTGFTLVELMVVLTIAAIVLAIGAPSFGEFRRNNRLTSAANDFLGAVHLARTEAIKRQRAVAVCPSADPETPAASCSGGDFTGWIVFQDDDNDCIRDPAEPFLRGDGPLDPAISTNSNGVCISFAGTGFIQTAAVTMQPEATRTVFCDERGMVVAGGSNLSAGRGLMLEVTGRPRVTRDATSGLATDVTTWPIGCP